MNGACGGLYISNAARKERGLERRLQVSVTAWLTAVTDIGGHWCWIGWERMTQSGHRRAFQHPRLSRYDALLNYWNEHETARLHRGIRRRSGSMAALDERATADAGDRAS